MTTTKKALLLAMILFIGWMAVIFLFSNQPSKESIALTARMLDVGIEVGDKIGVDVLGTTDKNTMINNLRQMAHFVLYGFLSVFGLFFIRRMQFKGFKSYVLVMVLCLAFALSDEYHQSFVLERTMDIVDIYFDMAGAMVGAVVYWVGQMVLSSGKWKAGTQNGRRGKQRL